MKVKDVTQAVFRTDADQLQVLATFGFSLATAGCPMTNQSDNSVVARLPRSGWRSGSVSVKVTTTDSNVAAVATESGQMPTWLIVTSVLLALTLLGAIFPLVVILMYVLTVRKQRRAITLGFDRAVTDLQRTDESAPWRRRLRAGTPMWEWLNGLEDDKLTRQISACLPSIENSEYPLAFIRVASQLRESALDHDWLLATTHRLVIGLPSKLKGLHYYNIDKSVISSIGVGETTHTQAKGFVSSSYALVSLTIRTTDGRVFVQHITLGANQAQVNSRNPYILSQLQAIREAGYNLIDGPGWNSVSGYTRSIGYGVVRFSGE